MEWSSRTVLVTGASGIVGSWLVKALLARRARVVALIRDLDAQSELVRSGTLAAVTQVRGALEDFAALRRALNEHEVDTVMHLGAQTIVGAALRDPLATFEANIRGTYHLLEAVRRQGEQVRAVVIASSDKAYGEAPELPYRESHPLQGRHPYDVSKSCTDLLASTYHQTYGLPVAISRCGNIYGGGDLNWSRIVPGTIRSYHRGERPILRSDGTMVRDYLYVEDVVAAYLDLAENLHRPEVAGQAFNFGPEQPLTVLELVQAIQQVMAAEHLPPIIRNTARGEIHSQWLSSAKARAVLGWTPRFSLAEGLLHTVSWYRSYWDQAGFAEERIRRSA
jgi:CDP-glucose 4,6-dehydratase